MEVSLLIQYGTTAVRGVSYAIECLGIDRAAFDGPVTRAADAMPQRGLRRDMYLHRGSQKVLPQRHPACQQGKGRHEARRPAAEELTGRDSLRQLRCCCIRRPSAALFLAVTRHVRACHAGAMYLFSLDELRVATESHGRNAWHSRRRLGRGSLWVDGPASRTFASGSPGLTGCRLAAKMRHATAP